MSTKIEWTDETWNPLVGCAHVSPGCDNCYAARETAGRLSGHPLYEGLAVRSPGEPAKFTGEIRLAPDRLDQPLRWRRPRRIFVNSMSDLFHPDVPDDFIVKVFGVMVAAGQHTFQVLTKRPQRMAQLVGADWFAGAVQREVHDVHETHMFAGWPYPSIWLGTSIESDRYTFRANHLRNTPAAVRFISAEPLLGALPSLDLTGIDWLIAGGESGPGARPMHPDWARDLRDTCAMRNRLAAHHIPIGTDDPGLLALGAKPIGPPPNPTAFHFKQWGEWRPAVEFCRPGPQDDPFPNHPLHCVELDGVNHGVEGIATETSYPMQQVGKKTAGRELDGRTWDEYPL